MANIPTRTEIQVKINALKSGGSTSLSNDISSWLDGESCPADDKVKILSDLHSYTNYP